MASRSFVAATPVAGRSHISPASRPAFSAECTQRPTSSIPGWSMTPWSDLVPMLPVAHWTTRSAVTVRAASAVAASP